MHTYYILFLHQGLTFRSSVLSGNSFISLRHNKSCTRFVILNFSSVNFSLARKSLKRCDFVVGHLAQNQHRYTLEISSTVKLFSNMRMNLLQSVFTKVTQCDVRLFKYIMQLNISIMIINHNNLITLWCYLHFRLTIT